MKKIISLLTVVFLTTGLNAAEITNNENIANKINEELRISIEKELKESGDAMMEQLQAEIMKINEERIGLNTDKISCEHEGEYKKTKV